MSLQNTHSFLVCYWLQVTCSSVANNASLSVHATESISQQEPETNRSSLWHVCFCVSRYQASNSARVINTGTTIQARLLLCALTTARCLRRRRVFRGLIASSKPCRVCCFHSTYLLVAPYGSSRKLIHLCGNELGMIPEWQRKSNTKATDW
jgi:hypothetical protein